MPLHILKLCVGAESVDDLRDWVAERCLQALSAGLDPHSYHITRMVPKRVDALLDGGSLYWVIKGQVQARQRLLGVESFTDEEGITRCKLTLGPEVIETVTQPKRAFQGWRYYPHEDVPRDLTDIDGALGEMPAELRRELAELGLL